MPDLSETLISARRAIGNLPCFFFFQAEDGIRDADVTGVQTCALPICAVTYHGRWTYKYEELARRGALGALIVHETAPAAYGWETVRASGLSPLFDIPRADRSEERRVGKEGRARGWAEQ